MKRANIFLIPLKSINDFSELKWIRVLFLSKGETIPGGSKSKSDIYDASRMGTRLYGTVRIHNLVDRMEGSYQLME